MTLSMVVFPLPFFLWKSEFFFSTETILSQKILVQTLEKFRKENLGLVLRMTSALVFKGL